MSDISTTSGGDTIWVEKDALIDRIPRSVAMILLFIVIVAIWDLVTRMGWVSPIILPSPGETLADLIFVGTVGIIDPPRAEAVRRRARFADSLHAFDAAMKKPPDFSGGLKLFRAKSYSHHRNSARKPASSDAGGIAAILSQFS